MRRMVALLLLCSCFHVRIAEKTFDAQKQQTVLATPFTDAVINETCPLDTVRYTSNLGFTLLAVLTLGIVNFVTVEYNCAPQTGVVHDPGPAPDPFDGGS